MATKKKTAAANGNGANGDAGHVEEVDPIALMIGDRVTMSDSVDPRLLVAIWNVIGDVPLEQVKDPRIAACLKYGGNGWRDLPVAVLGAVEDFDAAACILHTGQKRYDQLAIFAPASTTGQKMTWTPAALHYLPRDDDLPRPPEPPRGPASELTSSECVALDIAIGRPEEEAYRAHHGADSDLVERMSVTPLTDARFCTLRAGNGGLKLWMFEPTYRLLWPLPRRIEKPARRAEQPQGRRSLAPSQQGIF